MAAATVLATLKLGLVWQIGQIGTDGSQIVMLAMLPLLLGADLVGAACVAAVAAGPGSVWGWRGWRGRAWAAGVQALHGSIAATSTLAVVDLGGPLNRSFLGLTYMKLADWTPAMAASTGDYFGADNLAVIGGAALVGVGLGLGPPMSRAWGLGRRAVLGGLVIATFGFLPVAKGGWIGLRLQTHDLEASPWIELVGSYARPAWRALTSRDDDASGRFRFDFSSVAERGGAGERVVTPLARARPRPSNLLVILQESVGRRYVDDPSDPMPWLRGLLERPDVVSLDAHHATWSLTTKSLFSLLCSEMPYPTYRPISYVHAAIPCASLSDSLHRAGWFTALVTPQQLQFDRLRTFLDHRGFDRIYDASNLPGAAGRWQSAWGYEDQVAVDALLQLVAERKAAAPEQPLFLLYQQVSGHHPFLATEAQANAPAPDRLGNYLRALRAADDAARAAVEGLRRLDLLDDTLVAVVADHGEGHGRLAGRNAYEPVVRVPAALFGPQITEGGRVAATTSMIDLAPTLLALLGRPVPCPMQGRDLTAPAGVPPRLALFGGRPPKFQIGVADGPWHYILEDDRRQSLFRIGEDPDHDHDLAHLHPVLADAYRARVVAWRGHARSLLEDYPLRLAGSECAPPDLPGAVSPSGAGTGGP